MKRTERTIKEVVGDLELWKIELCEVLRELHRINCFPERNASEIANRMIADACDRVSMCLDCDAAAVRELGRNHRQAADQLARNDSA